jgi:hypothetical protein
VVRAQRRLVDESINELESHGRPERHRHGDGAIQLDDGDRVSSTSAS